ncbi:TonB-dependent receptor [Aestuariibaculum sp. YM273]|uniref:TonB-dependent receptor domain-containing protein n=1 Tax=Aestuariibaculum sp. YM273 TaxID=3070659 RepID=UPI0027DC8216|nr:TonB-dependent receptor [Aestuariibaculum sp. YM273]WMI66490.1 TonB-dependent receptor [Aestuariibaculum sp. YM273]
MKTLNKTISLFIMLFSATLLAQTTISGSVVDSNNQPLVDAHIIIENSIYGTYTDTEGHFILTVDITPPFNLSASRIGYKTLSIQVLNDNQIINFILDEGTDLDDTVVYGSRKPESVRESPVPIEIFDATDIRLSTATPNFYTSLENLKGVDINHGSLTFNSVNTRGFATFANNRFVQLIDGMDNASPALNFVMGNLVGMNELDVHSVELLPGASSALYGANAFNGILFMTSKNPFNFEGISTYYKQGITSQDAAGNNTYRDFGIRAAHKFSDKFAGKASFSYLKGTDWYATDYNEYTRGLVGTPDNISPFRSSPAHDGLNIYGDEISLGAALGMNLKELVQAYEGFLFPIGSSMLVPEDNVARTGYRELDLTDYNANSLKADFALHYRPLADDLEIIWNSRLGRGNTIFQGGNRYQLKNFFIQQHRLEIKNDNFFLRGYTTSEKAGDSYDMFFTGLNMNKVGAEEWFGTYAGAYIQGAAQVQASGGNPFDSTIQEQLHTASRNTADQLVTIQPGTPQFRTLFNQITSDPDVNTGSKFIDNSKMYVVEGNYNFSRLLRDALDLQIGGSARQYALNSQGTIFTDYDGPIKYDEYGAYIQGIKKLADDRLKVTASIRYDKNEFFDANLSPRISLVYFAGANKNHNIRASFQTGFRNPHTQSLFIGLNVGNVLLVGGAPTNLDRNLPNTNLTARDAYSDSYSLASFLAFAASQGASPIEPVNGTGMTPLVEPEKVKAFDLGYRGTLGPVDIDFSAYYNNYDNFLAEKVVITPNSGSTSDLSGIADIASGNYTIFQLNTNSSADISSYGAIIGLSTRIAKDFKLSASYNFAKFDFDQSSDPDFSAGFNTPEHKVKISFGNANLFKNFGFQVNGRWSDEYLWQANIANAMIPSRTVIDAQINYTIPAIKSIFKIGGTNLGGKEYQSAVGTGYIGQQYFISWTINNL